MKKILILGFLLFSLNGMSQSYLILSNGVTLTTDSNGYLYDFSHFHLPYKINYAGGQFFVEDNKLITVDSKGLLFEKDLEVEEIKGKGNNYFINGDNELITLDKDGFYYKFEDESSLFKKTTGFGGNYFLVKPEKKKPTVEIYTINEKGNYYKMNLDGLNPADISTLGGNFFQTKDGKTFTVSKMGFIFSKPDIDVSAPLKLGGNYFISSTGILHTVSEEGILVVPTIPKDLNVSEIQKLGSNYMIDKLGRIFIVDKNGSIEERNSQHDLKNTKVLSL